MNTHFLFKNQTFAAFSIRFSLTPSSMPHMATSTFRRPRESFPEKARSSDLCTLQFLKKIPTYLWGIVFEVPFVFGGVGDSGVEV